VNNSKQFIKGYISKFLKVSQSELEPHSNPNFGSVPGFHIIISFSKPTFLKCQNFKIISLFAVEKTSESYESILNSHPGRLVREMI